METKSVPGVFRAGEVGEAGSNPATDSGEEKPPPKLQRLL